MEDFSNYIRITNMVKVLFYQIVSMTNKMGVDERRLLALPQFFNNDTDR
jgi:hypothetical protein